MKKIAAVKKKAVIKQTFPFVSFFFLTDFRSASVNFRGNIGIRNLNTFGFGDSTESLRFRTTNSNSTLVVFTEANYQGSFHVFRGETSVADLRDFNLENDINSFVMAGRRITTSEISQIQQNAAAPTGFAEIRRRVIAKRKGGVKK